MFESYKDSLFNDKIILKSQQVFRDYKPLIKLLCIPYGTNAFRVCGSEMLIVRYCSVEKYADCLFLW